MKPNKEELLNIEKAIKELNLTNKELDSITTGTMDKICKMANVKQIKLMYYLRFMR